MTAHSSTGHNTSARARAGPGQPPDRPIPGRARWLRTGAANLRGDAVLVGGAIGALALLAAGVLLAGPGGHDHDGSTAAGWLRWSAMWLVMVVAMMLPTSTGIAIALSRVARGRADRTRILAAGAAGYLLVWLVAGLVANAATVLGRGLVDRATPQVPDPTMPGMTTPAPGAALPVLAAAAVLLLAGALQLSPVTGRCLTACRRPAGFFARHWTGNRPRAVQAAAVGLAYGRSCLGCCAALMAVLLLVGMDNLVAMVATATLMVVQKNTRHGRSVARATGAALLAAGLVVALSLALAPALLPGWLPG